jgi:hypothetical protein
MNLRPPVYAGWFAPGESGLLTPELVSNAEFGYRFADDFARANLYANGKWVERDDSCAIYDSDYAYGTTVANNICSSVEPLRTNDIRVGARINGTLPDIDTGLGIGGSDKMCWVNVTPTALTIGTSTGWQWQNGWIERATAAYTPEFGDMISLERQGTTFSARYDGKVLCTWNDSGGYIPKDASHRYIEMAFAGTAGGWDDLDARDMFYRMPNSYNVYQGYVDSFDRANDASSLNGWWWTVTGVMGISGNKAYNPTGSTYAGAVYKTASQFADCAVGASISGVGANEWVNLLLGSETDKQVWLTFNNAGINIQTSTTTWGLTNQTQRASWSGTVSDGNYIFLERSGNTYRAWQGTNAPNWVWNERCSWVDSGDYIPRNAAHPWWGMGIYHGSATNTVRIDSIDFWEIISLPADNLIDDFTTQNTDKWTWDANASVVAGQLNMSCGALVDGVTSRRRYDLTGSSVIVEMIQGVAPSAGNYSEVGILIQPSAGEYIGIGMYKNGTSAAALFCNHGGAGADDYSRTFNATTDRWWRISEFNNVVYFDTSPDNRVWTNRKQVTNVGYILSDVTIILYAYGPGGSTAILDHFNVRPQLLTGTDNLGMSDTIDMQEDYVNPGIGITDTISAIIS